MYIVVHDFPPFRIVPEIVVDGLMADLLTFNVNASICIIVSLIIK